METNNNKGMTLKDIQLRAKTTITPTMVDKSKQSLHESVKEEILALLDYYIETEIEASPNEPTAFIASEALQSFFNDNNY